MTVLMPDVIDISSACVLRRSALDRQSDDGSRRKKVTVSEHDWLVDRFEVHRGHLRAVAQRMLGSSSEADDAVQEAWLRLSRSDTTEIENLGGWLTTVVARVSLDMLRSRASRREEPSGAPLPDDIEGLTAGSDPEHEALLADTVGSALLVVLDMLSPAERLAFVLHDMFAVPFDEIGAIVGRSSNAAKQLASRARQPRGPRPHTARGLAGEQFVQALVALAHAVLHAAGDERVAGFKGVDQRGRRESGATVAEVLEDAAFEGHAVGKAFEREGLHDHLRRAHLVEAAVEAELVAVTGVHVAVGTAGAAVPRVDAHLVAAGPEPLRDELGVGVGPEDLPGRRVELAGDAHEGDLRVDGDLGLAGGRGHRDAPVWGG